MHNEISFIIPSRNTVEYTKLAYSSIRKYYPNYEIVILDESDADNTWEWLSSIKDSDANLTLWKNPGKMLGHCITYDMGIKMCRNKLFSIFHSDMVCTSGYVENLIKHWKPRTVVSATRMEPQGIYPPGKEKILIPLSPTIESFNQSEFERCAQVEQKRSNGFMTKGIFAPWLMSKEDFLAIGGHDHTSFAPWPTEDSDIFLRFCLAGYTIIQSRDSICYHFISKGHRNWAKNGIGNDDADFKFYQTRSIRNYIRKWNRMYSQDEYACPILHPVYDLAFDVRVDSVEFLSVIEPWAQKVYVDESSVDVVNRYIEKEQPNTNIDLRNRIYISPAECMSYHDLILTFDEKTFMKKPRENMMLLNNLNKLLSESELEAGKFELDDTFKLTVNRVADISSNFINVINP